MNGSPSSAESPPPPLRVLCVIANPSDLPRIDASRVWTEIDEALQPFIQNGSVVIQRPASLTEIEIRNTLAKGRFHILHFVGHAQARSANYGTIALLASDGRARLLAPKAVASLLADNAVGLCILQACDDAGFCFDSVGVAAAERGIAVAVTPTLSGAAQKAFLAKLYAGLLTGRTPQVLTRELSAIAPQTARLRIMTSRPDAPIFSLAQQAAAPQAAAPPPAPVPQPSQVPIPAPAPPAWHQQLALKRAQGTFDVFLCHSSKDKPAVKSIGQRLKENGLLPWLDIWELPPGQPWQPLLERQIGSIRAAAVFVGAGGLGPWQEQELYTFLREFVRRQVPVIPVLLPEAPKEPDLPLFLTGMTYVDFRLADPDPFQQLIWGITGQHPDD